MRSFTPKRAETQRTFTAPEKREPAHKRGYDWIWAKLAKRYRKQHPICETEGCKNPTQEIDHIIPFQGKADPKRLQWSNLKALCRSCHARKTYRDKGGE